MSRTHNFGDSDVAALAEEASTVSTMTRDGRIEHGILAQDLMTEVMGVVPVLGGKKVTVGFAGDGAFCNGDFSYVNIPALPPAKVIPLQIAREIRGFAAHEAAHLAFTDQDVFPSRIVDAGGNFDPLLKEVWNCIEDFMIERNWLELYPGARKNFAATEIRCCQSYMKMYGENPDVAKDLRSVGPVALTWLRAIHFNLGTQVSRDCFNTMPAELRQRVIGYFSDIQDVETTQDCLEVARIIRDDIDSDPFDPNALPKSQQQHQQQNQGQNSQGQQAQGQNSQGQQAQGSGQQSGGQNSQGQQSGGRNSPGQGAGQQDPNGSGGQQDPNSGNSGGSKAAGASSGSPQQGQGPGAGNCPAPDVIPTSHDLPGSLASDGVETDPDGFITAQVLSTTGSGPMSSVINDPEGTRKSMEAQKEISGIIASTSAQMRKSLKSISRDRWRGGRTEGRVDPGRLSGAVLGSPEIYRRKVRGEAIDTAVSILIDCSHSMDGCELEICQQMSLALESALAPTKVNHEIIGFTTGDLSEADPIYQTMAAANDKNGTPIAIRAISMYEFRSFGATHAQALMSIGNMRDVHLVGTPTDQAILLAHDRLARRPEKRHVLFVLTDGAPNDIDGCKKAVKSVESCGVTVVGIGIGTDKVKQSFTDHTTVMKATDLPAVMMSKLSGILIGDRGKVALTGEKAASRRRRRG